MQFRAPMLGTSHDSIAMVALPTPPPVEEGSLPPPKTKLPACCCAKLMLSTGTGSSFGCDGAGASLQMHTN